MVLAAVKRMPVVLLSTLPGREVEDPSNEAWIRGVVLGRHYYAASVAVV